jgi:hypothetical protein
MERGIEDRDLRDIREQVACGIHTHSFARVVRRREWFEGDERALDVVVDPHRVRETRAAVDDAMADSTQTAEIDADIAHRLTGRCDRILTAADAEGPFDRRRRGLGRPR